MIKGYSDKEIEELNKWYEDNGLIFHSDSHSMIIGRLLETMKRLQNEKDNLENKRIDSADPFNPALR